MNGWTYMDIITYNMMDKLTKSPASIMNNFSINPGRYGNSCVPVYRYVCSNVLHVILQSYLSVHKMFLEHKMF